MKGNLNLRPLAVFSAIIAFSTSALAQNIGVVINNQPVRFTGVGPQSIRGRVLVPLRGVLERLGAYVGYESATQTVTASRGDIDIQLRIGDATARVNGRDIALDVPPQIYRGSTLVPLRFMGQALGAEVQWDNATRTVNITTSDAEADVPSREANAGNIQITSFTAEPEGYSRGGSNIEFTLRGTPGGTASLQIPGVTREIRMRETNPGVYTATYVVPNDPANPVAVSGANAIARLRVGNAERLIQASNTISVDTKPPVIRESMPQADSRVNINRPSFSVSFDDAGGSGVDPASVTMTLDGRNVTNDAVVTGDRLTYKPSVALEAGLHEVSISVRDRAGNTASKAYSFRVVAGSEAIRSFTHTGTGNAQPGDVLTFVLLGEPGGRATFSIGETVKNRAMEEEAPGRYIGEYTVRKGDNFRDDVVTARLRTKAGETFTAQAASGVAVNAGALEAPKLTSPEEGARIGAGNLIVRGTAGSGARVRIRVEYSATLLGLLERKGTLYDQVVDADQNGKFETRPIDVNFLGADRNTTYTITAVTLGANETASEATVLRVKR